MILAKQDYDLYCCVDIVNDVVPEHSRDYNCYLEVLSHASRNVVPALIMSMMVVGVVFLQHTVLSVGITAKVYFIDETRRYYWIFGRSGVAPLTSRPRTINGQTEPIQIVYFRTLARNARSFLEYRKEQNDGILYIRNKTVCLEHSSPFAAVFGLERKDRRLWIHTR